MEPHPDVNATSAGQTVTANPLLTIGLNIGLGQTLGIYLQGLLPATSANIRYQGDGQNPAVTTFSNAGLSMFTSHARTGGVAFGGSLFTPRGFAGSVNYELSSSPVPEPSTMVLFGAGLLGAAALRKRRVQ